MSFAALTAVRATRDIEHFRTVVAKSGTPGTVIDLHVDRPAVTYTVDFTPEGVCGAHIRLTGLTDTDISPFNKNSDKKTPSPTCGGNRRRRSAAYRGWMCCTAGT